MENVNKKIIHIEENDGIVSIIDKIKKCKKNEIVLVVPSKDALLFQSVINLKIIKRKCGEIGKKLYVVIDKKNNRENVKPRKIYRDEILRKQNVNKDINKDFKILDIVKKTDDFDPDKIKTFANSKRKIHQSNDANKNGKKEKASTDFIKKEKSAYNHNNIDKTKKGKEKKSLAEKKKPAFLSSLDAKFVALFIVVCFIVFAMSVAFILPKADVSIILKVESKTHNFTFTTDDSIKEADYANYKVPKKNIEAIATITETYKTKKKKHFSSKASGEITVFNEYSKFPQRLVANTRFVSGGYVFRVKNPITIPGFSFKSREKIPGQVKVTVYAEKPGEEYNIGPSSFTLPGLITSAKYSKIYAKSSSNMIGGINKESFYFSEEDYETAKSNLIKSVSEESKRKLLDKISSNYIIIGDIKQSEEIKIENGIKIGDIANDFQMNVSIKSSVSIADKRDIEMIVDKKIKTRTSSNLKFIKDGGKFELGDISTNESGETKIPVRVTQDFVAKLNVNEIKNEIKNKNEAELKEYFGKITGVKSVTVELWPFWVRNVPSIEDKINIVVSVEK